MHDAHDGTPCSIPPITRACATAACRSAPQPNVLEAHVHVCLQSSNCGGLPGCCMDATMQPMHMSHPSPACTLIEALVPYAPARRVQAPTFHRAVSWALRRGWRCHHMPRAGRSAGTAAPALPVSPLRWAAARWRARNRCRRLQSTALPRHASMHVV